MQYLLLLLVIVVTKPIASEPRKYRPDWKNLDSRPLPQWYDEAKFGIFVHWGIYSVPAIINEWFWFKWDTLKDKTIAMYMNSNFPPGFSYEDFAPMLKAQLFEPDKWAELFFKSGAKFVVLTGKHHDGYTLFPSKYSPNWNSVDIGPNRDIVQELSHAVLKQGLKFGLYYSLLEWYNPLYQIDKLHRRNRSRVYIDQKMKPELIEMVNEYKPSVIWSDGDWIAHDSYWKSEEFLAWLYSDSLVKDEVVVNDRWGFGHHGKHGDFYNFADKYNNFTLEDHKWENAFPLDINSWGYRVDMDLRDIVTVPHLILQLVTTVSCGGNFLLNVGPTKEGKISPIFQHRLLSMGKWLSINGEAIYSTSPWLHQNDIYNGKVWYTCTKTTYNAVHPTAIPGPDDVIKAVYAIALGWPKGNVLKLGSVSSYLLDGNCKVELLGHKGHLKWWIVKGISHIRFPDKSTVKSEHAWTIKCYKKQ